MRDFEKFRTINDLDPNEQLEYARNYMDENIVVIKKHLGVFNLQRLKRGFISRIFFRNEEITVDNDLVETNCCFSLSNLKIPHELFLTTYLMISSNLKVDGIFRKNAEMETLNECLGIIKCISSNEIEMYKGIDKIKSKFDIICITEAYKAMLKVYGLPVIPSSYLEMATRISRIDDICERKVCSKALIYGLPFLNRKMVETVVYVCFMLEEEFRKQQSKCQMDLKGICVTLMPNLFKLEMEKVRIEDIKDLSDILYFWFRNFREFITI